MLALCYRYTGNKEDAEEIFQQSFYLIYKNIGQLKDPKAISGWIKRIFVNTSIHYLQDRRKNYMTKNIDEVINYDNHINDAISDLELGELRKLIQELPNGRREIFNMFVIEGYSHQEIAEKLNISIGTSKSQLFDARKMLIEALHRIATFEDNAIQKKIG